MADKWISLEESERQQSGEAPSSDRVAERERERERQAKREALLKSRMLEERLAELEDLDRESLEAIL